MCKISKWLSSKVQPTTAENTYTPRVRVQSTVDEGKGLSFNEKAQHIFNEIRGKK